MARPRRVWDGIRDTPKRIRSLDPVVEGQDTWRDRIQRMNGLKFDDEAKLDFLRELDRSGKIGLACQAAGISYGTYADHKDRDPKFLEAVHHTIKVFNEGRASRLERQAMNGFKEVVIGPNGERDYRQKYETQLRVMVLRAADREMYEDRSTLQLGVAGGAFIIPATLAPADWEAQFAEQQDKFIPDSAGAGHILTEGEEQPVMRPKANE
jgi:hypothetical protein